eukprot:TRINITY_DN8356_c0_g1_i1.p1 TRINITY_DN8356_c0_g1~~TRINITY_DN8356_c0_g1_i1.p1  ORF type:complete len:592 (-),score=81.51 TRINITY_DN8356_c0_g1_i1:447-2222(-)
MKASQILSSVVLLSIFCAPHLCDDRTHRYEIGERVILWANKVGPYYNPQETYKYFSLPYCKPSPRVEHRTEGLGEALQGNELVNSDHQIFFLSDVEHERYCSVILGVEENERFRSAIRNHYWFQFYLDDLPIWGMIGRVGNNSNQDTAVKDQDQKVFIYTHKRIAIGFNKNRIIEVNLTPESPIELKDGNVLEFTYSVIWYPVTTPFRSRYEKYLDHDFFEHQTHWFSILNSFMMVIFLTGVVSMILMRALKKDYAKYSRDDISELDREIGEDSGWKQVHADVFRAPPYVNVFSALIGTGCQLVLLLLSVIFLSIIGTLYRGRGSLITVGIISYAFMSFVGGYCGSMFYSKQSGFNWMRVATFTTSIFPGTVLFISIVLTIVARSYQSLAAAPIGSLIAVILIWLIISVPLTLFGAMVGKTQSILSEPPCKINQTPRPIPVKKLYFQPIFLMFAGGLLPFGSIFIETYFVFTSIWSYKVYYVYGFLLLVYIILIIVTVCTSIVAVYFLLSSEDYRWQWTSFFCGASTAIYLFLYSIYYFHTKTNMTGTLQTVFYYGYTLILCFAVWIVCGTVAYIGCYIFIDRIYRNVKLD